MARRKYEPDMEKVEGFSDEELTNTGGELPKLSFTSGTYSFTVGGGGGSGGSGEVSVTWPTAGVGTISTSSITYGPPTPIVKRYSMRDHIREVLDEVGVTEEDLVEASYIPPMLTVTYRIGGSSATATITTEVLKSPF